jgi:hypothetical protein
MNPADDRLLSRPDHRRRTVAATVAAPRVLMIESLDAAGSDRADARERCSALRGLRAVVRVAILNPGRNGPDVGAATAITTSGAFAEWDTGPAGLAQLREFAREGRFDHILIAAAAHGGGAAVRALPRGMPASWWPTGVSPAPGWRARLGFGRPAGLPPLVAGSDGSDPDLPGGLAWSSVGPRQAGRGRLTLWDGEYLLAPLPLASDDGSRLLAAFASLGSEWCGLDLVVLSEPQPAFEREARARGVGARVHFVGQAPREAEGAWWSHASGAVFAGTGAVSGGFVLRGLNAGCPMGMLQSDGPGAAIRTWLDRNGCLARAPDGGGGDAVATLARLLGRGPVVNEAVARGRALAAEHGWERTAKRLTAALPWLTAATVRPRPAAAA